MGGRDDREGDRTRRAEWSQLPSQRGFLGVRPHPPAREPLESGIQELAGGANGPSLLHVPTRLPEGPAPLLVLLHGASSTARNILPITAREAERHGILVLAPQSRGYSWDVILGGFGPDVVALDEMLAQVFDRFPVDHDRVAIGGFSDGASYALSLGLINGELFRSILAFSPGFVVPGRRQGRPRVFISHGTADTVLPIDRCSRRIVPLLQSEGYDVDYREFRGAHEVPAAMVAAAVQLLA